MRRLVLALALAVVACSSPSPHAAQSSLSATITPSPAAITGDLPVFQYGLYDTAGNNQRLVGGFLRFPGGAFQRSAGADMVRDDYGEPSPLTRTTVQPFLFGFGEVALGQTTYDGVAARWLPVAPHQVSDDGLRYAYRELLRGDPNAIGDQPPREVRFHVVDVRTGSNQVLFTANGAPPPWVIAGVSEQAIWLTRCGNEGTGCWGSLWRLDTATGKLSKVSDRRGIWVIGGGAGWTVICSSPRYPPGATNSPPADICLMGLADSKPDQLLRIDLTTGTEETWDRQSGIVLLGIGREGLPMLKLNTGDESTLLRVTRRGQTERLFAVPVDRLNPGGGFEGPVVSDETGTWLSVVDGSPQPRAVSPAMAVGIYMYSES